MIAFLANIAPIMLGFIGKLFALKSQAAAENQKLMIQFVMILSIKLGIEQTRKVLWLQ